MVCLHSLSEDNRSTLETRLFNPIVILAHFNFSKSTFPEYQNNVPNIPFIVLNESRVLLTTYKYQSVYLGNPYNIQCNISDSSSIASIAKYSKYNISKISKAVLKWKENKEFLSEIKKCPNWTINISKLVIDYTDEFILYTITSLITEIIENYSQGLEKEIK
mmetsp:Transcript_12442/g.11026  ORF Transcript_12442/g.11026 Transcript_12442/m.11026 type:complete len:162 (-) Transcript_12442:118-603(-)